MTVKKVTATVFRYDPSQGAEPRYETYEVPYAEDMRILDVLHAIQERHDSSLAFRYSCRRRRCGMCAVMVNGRPVLACFEGAEREMTIDPLPNLPIVRDLVVETEPYEDRTIEIHPFLERDHLPEEPEKTAPAQFEGLKPLQTCIECYACMSVCPVIDIKWKDFAGPATLVQLAKRALDPRDNLERIRLILRGATSDCVSCYACVEACPIKINVLEQAIEKLRGQCAEKEVGAWAKFNRVFVKQVAENGLVTPFILMLKTRGLCSLFTSLPIGFKFALKNKITYRKQRISKVNDVKRIYRAAGEKT